MSSDPKPAPRGGLSLYANLLDSSANSGNTISSAPVMYNKPGAEPQQEEAARKQFNPASLRFQPTKRPQLSSQKVKAKAAFPKPLAMPTSSSSPDTTGKIAALVSQPVVKTTLADWTADDDDINGFYAGEKRQRGGRKKRKRNRQEETVAVTDWDDIYDPSKPTSYEQYMHSDERIAEIREWKDRLYAHRMTRRQSSELSSDKEGSRGPTNRQFAPPANYSFAPPNFDISTEEDSRPTEIVDDPTGDDAYARRMRMSGMQNLPTEPDAEPVHEPLAANDNTTSTAPGTSNATLSPRPSATIFRAPIRYDVAAEPEEPHEPLLEAEESPVSEEAPRSNRPGQAGFAQRLMEKMGWEKGKGLGASGTGIINPLQVRVEKRKKRPDSEGGGFVDRGGKGKIIGGKKAKGIEYEGKFGKMSDIVVLYDMLEGLDLDVELAEGDLMQEIGQSVDQYGRVDRLYIDRNAETSPPVFIKYTSELSALRAVNSLDGSLFRGNFVRAKYFDSDQFARGVYN